jgi:Ca2+-binding RTX toxin-like protein
VKILPAVSLLFLLAPAAADAATVSVFGGPSGPEVRYAAAAGETNHLNVAYAGDARSVTVTDPGATIVAGDGCVNDDDHTATCRPLDGGFLQHTVAALGDGGDSVTTSRPPGPPIGGVDADGGPGDDLLDGGAGSDTLAGGDGSDTLLGGDGGDYIRADAADTVAGGPGTFDTLSREDDTAGVEIDLTSATTPGFENAVGGSGNDNLAGIAQGSRLEGRGGDDHLWGEAGDDTLDGGPGEDDLRGNGGNDILRGGEGVDSWIGCHTGTDIAINPHAGELLRRSCERLQFSFGDEGLDSMSWRPNPTILSKGRIRHELTCPRTELLDGSTAACRGTLTLRAAHRAHALIGRASFKRATEAGAFRVRITLTRRGRALAKRHHGVVTTARVSGINIPTRAWTYRLQT